MIEKYAIIQKQDPKKEWHVLKCLKYTIKKKRTTQNVYTFMVY